MGARARFAMLVTLCLWGGLAPAQQETQGAREDLDVTMQIIVDPDAKLPDEVVRRIELPARKAAEPPARGSEQQSTPAEPAAPGQGNKDQSQGQDRAAEARQLGREMAERAKELAKEAAEQREEARRSVAEERRRNNPGGPPAEPPGNPRRPPRP